MPPKKTMVTRGSASQKQRAYIESLAKESSAPKVRKPKKSPEKPASFESPEVTKNPSQAVTLPKSQRAKTSNELNSDSDSTGSETASTGNSTVEENSENALATMTTPFDAKLKHVLTHFLNAI